MSRANRMLLGPLRMAHRLLDRSMRDRWDRSVPLPDLINDRWDRATRLGFGLRSSVYDSCLVLGDVRVGEDCWIGPGTILDGSGGPLSIGDWCTVSAGAHIYTHDTILRGLSGGNAARATGQVTIASHVYVGPNAIVTAGIAIGTMSVIGANSMVNRDVAERSVVAGTPARLIGQVVGEGADVRIVTRPSTQFDEEPP